jgi:hypothetical protein|tara:strand:+ start:2817 stop:2975 length:159 start_codon:yes stop_codon:yes gene_type:complete
LLGDWRDWRDCGEVFGLILGALFGPVLAKLRRLILLVLFYWFYSIGGIDGFA